MTVEVFKWALVALMVLDHVAVALGWPGEWRLPGRLVFPGFAALMAHHLAQGVPREKYLRRLLPFGGLAQPAYSLAFGSPLLWPLNVLFTLGAGAVFLRSPLLGGILSLLTEFPLGGIAIGLAARGQALPGALAVGGSAWLFGWPLWVAMGQALAFLLFLRLIPHLEGGRRSPWWAFYAFYPGHLYVLWLLWR